MLEELDVVDEEQVVRAVPLGLNPSMRLSRSELMKSFMNVPLVT